MVAMGYNALNLILTIKCNFMTKKYYRSIFYHSFPEIAKAIIEMAKPVEITLDFRKIYDEDGCS